MEMNSFMAPPRFGRSERDGGLPCRRRRPVSLPALTFERLTATERNAQRGRIPTKWNSTKEHGSWFGKARFMKSRPAMAIQPWRDTKWGVKLSIDRQRPHLLSHQSSRDRES